MELDLTPSELQLMVRLVEANDSSNLDRRGRLGALRVRTSLTQKLYDAKDSLPAGETEQEGGDDAES